MTTASSSKKDIIIAPNSDFTSAMFTSALLASPIRLDGTNFLLWKTLIVSNLSGLNLHGHLDDAHPVPEKTITEGEASEARITPNPPYQIWWQQDQRILGALLNLMTPDIVTQMVGLHTTAEAWKEVHDMFAAQNRATIRHTRLQLQTLKKRDMIAASYFQKIKSLADNLATTGSPLSTDELIDYILTGLGPNTDHLSYHSQLLTKTFLYQMSMHIYCHMKHCRNNIMKVSIGLHQLIRLLVQPIVASTIVDPGDKNSLAFPTLTVDINMEIIDLEATEIETVEGVISPAARSVKETTMKP